MNISVLVFVIFIVILLILFKKTKKKQPEPRRFLVLEEIEDFIDYGQSLGEIIKNGNYDEVSSLITSPSGDWSFCDNYMKLPVEGRHKISAKLLFFGMDFDNFDISSCYINSQMKKNNLRPAILKELLSLETQFSNKYRNPIVAINSHVFINRCTPNGYGSSKWFYPIFKRNNLPDYLKPIRHSPLNEKVCNNKRIIDLSLGLGFYDQRTFSSGSFFLAVEC